MRNLFINALSATWLLLASCAEAAPNSVADLDAVCQQGEHEGLTLVIGVSYGPLPPSRDTTYLLACHGVGDCEPIFSSSDNAGLLAYFDEHRTLAIVTNSANFWIATAPRIVESLDYELQLKKVKRKGALERTVWPDKFVENLRCSEVVRSLKPTASESTTE